MLSQCMLAQIDTRLRQATGHNVYFGGISMILIGDPGQLLPVGGSPLYQYPTKSNIASHGLNLYKQFNESICLEVVERQKNLNNDPDQDFFISLLTRARNGMNDPKFIEKDWEFLLRNKFQNGNKEEFSDAIRLYSDNQSCNDYNSQKLIELKSPITCIHSINTPARMKLLNDDNFSGLTKRLYIAIGAKINLTSNIWTSKGLVNGASGIIKDIVYSQDDKLMPKTIFIEFNHYTGPSFFQSDDPRHKWIPISPIVSFNTTYYGSRTGYPLRLAYAMTIHKSQGQTMNRVVIDLGKNEQSLGTTFVALSRVKNYKDFIIAPFSLERLQKISRSSNLKPRMEEEKRILDIFQNTMKYHQNLFL